MQVAIAWQLARSPQMLPIPGTSSVAHLEENVAAAAVELSDDDLALLGSCPSDRTRNHRHVGQTSMSFL